MSEEYQSAQSYQPSLFHFPPAAVQDSVRYYKFTKELKRYGTGSIIWGVINVIFGANWMLSEYPLDVVTVLLGLTMIALGIYVLARPSSIGWYIDAGVFFALAAWNLGNFAPESAAGTSNISYQSLVFGIIQVGFAILMISKGSKFGTMHNKLQALGPAHDWLQQEIKAIDKAPDGTRQDVVSVRVIQFSGKAVWRIIWGPGDFIFIHLKRGICYYVPRNTLSNAFAYQLLPAGNKVKIKANLWGKNTKFIFKAPEFQKLQYWLSQPAPA